MDNMPTSHFVIVKRFASDLLTRLMHMVYVLPLFLFGSLSETLPTFQHFFISNPGVTLYLSPSLSLPHLQPASTIAWGSSIVFLLSALTTSANESQVDVQEDGSLKIPIVFIPLISTVTQFSVLKGYGEQIPPISI